MDSAALSEERVRDRMAILDVLARYAQALDEKRYALLDDVFTPDAVIDMTSSGGIRGDRAAFAEWIPQALRLFPVTQHMLGQSVFDFDPDGTAARVVTYQSNPMGYGRDDGTIDLFVLGGCYRDRVARTSSGWRIQERVWHQVWQSGRIPDQLTLPALDPD
jgi:SnoaL-like domain